MFSTYFVSCNGPCAPKEKMAQKRTHDYYYECSRAKPQGGPRESIHGLDGLVDFKLTMQKNFEEKASNCWWGREVRKLLVEIPLIQFGCLLLVCPLLCFFLPSLVVYLSSLTWRRLSVESACVFVSSFVVHWWVQFPRSFSCRKMFQGGVGDLNSVMVVVVVVAFPSHASILGKRFDESFLKCFFFSLFFFFLDKFL